MRNFCGTEEKSEIGLVSAPLDRLTIYTVIKQNMRNILNLRVEQSRCIYRVQKKQQYVNENQKTLNFAP